MNTKAFGVYLKEARRISGLTLRQLAAKSEITPSYISLIENGKQNRISLEVFISLVNVARLDFFKSTELADVKIDIIEMEYLKNGNTKIQYKGKSIDKRELYKFLGQQSKAKK